MDDKQKVAYLLHVRQSESARQRQVRKRRYDRQLSKLTGRAKDAFVRKRGLYVEKEESVKSVDMEKLSETQIKNLVRAANKRFGSPGKRKRPYKRRWYPTSLEREHPEMARPEVIESLANIYDQRKNKEKQWRETQLKKYHQQRNPFPPPPLEWTPPPDSPSSPSLSPARESDDSDEEEPIKIPSDSILPMKPVPPSDAPDPFIFMLESETPSAEESPAIMEPAPLMSPGKSAIVMRWGPSACYRPMLWASQEWVPIFHPHNPFRDEGPYIRPFPPVEQTPLARGPLPMPVRLDLLQSPPPLKRTIYQPRRMRARMVIGRDIANGFLLGTHPLDDRPRAPVFSL